MPHWLGSSTLVYKEMKLHWHAATPETPVIIRDKSVMYIRVTLYWGYLIV